MANQQELAAQLKAVATQIQKIGTESKSTLEKVTKLEEALANSGGEISIELQEAVNDLKAQVAVVDDLVVDVPVTTEPEDGGTVDDDGNAVPEPTPA